VLSSVFSDILALMEVFSAKMTRKDLDFFFIGNDMHRSCIKLVNNDDHSDDASILCRF